MATVHIGRLLGPVGFARTVAIKRLHPQFAKDPEFVSMFLDEARLAARVQHPNVVATIDVVATDGELFLIMDYVRGESLSRLIRAAKKAGERIPPRIANSIVCGFLHGLHAAHEAKNERGEPINLVHRDVSPQNVLVGADGIARVLDFGIAKAAGRIQVTRDGQIKGKLAYMPPEQLSGRELTRTVDIYAAGVVMWETLTGERLFKGETEGETLAKILRDPINPPSAIVPTLPRTFDNVLLRALSRESSKRHATARELALELEKCASMASPTEVGEWVEAMCGPALSAREDQIAEIESNSAGIRVSPSGRPEPDTRSDSDFSAIPIQNSPQGTLLGVGPPSSGIAVSSRRQMRSVADIMRTEPDGAPPFAPGELPLGALPRDEFTNSKMTGTALSLPVERRLPILASAAGVLVLLVIVGLVIAGKASSSTATTEPSGHAPSASMSSADVPPPTTPSASATSVLPADPIPPPASPTPPVAEPPKTAETAPPKPPPTAPTVTHPRPNPAPKPTVTATATTPPAPAPKKNCDPPYTIDANGRKKYKLECM
ncbi:Serine/threonine-protein kinase Pkn6 [Labilithrix luteola]|uniref:Serine/threonine-protein kinase Pkn6 n=2 Tax=Labilithrix luteola TaxID=1391654 RepID=A0A0K1PNZ8_9BACT|nr:Serine/threonine-protein kinase Pkn6 [Labilithrix luteola]